VRSGTVRSIKNTHDACLSRGVRGCLGHLPVGVEMRSIDGKAEGAEQENAHREQY
jgi:hypothetical protein